MDGERRKAFGAAVIDAGADRAQRIDEIADRPLVHARHAGNVILAVAESERGGQWTTVRAGVAQEKVGLLLGERSADAAHLDAGSVLGQRHAEARERFAHDARVLGVEQSLHLRFALGQRGEQEDAVGDALRAGQAHAAACAARRLQLEDFSHRSRASRASAKSFSSAAASDAWSSFSTSPSCAWYRVSSPSSRSRLAMQMSRHISGWLDAMRVKSRKPPAA